MNKAFTKEPDGADAELTDELDSPDSDDESSVIPAGTKNYMTPGGFARLQDELKNLLHTMRPEVVRTVAWAASNGDRSENGDYIYGKRRLREIDRRIRFLTKRLDRAQVVDPVTLRFAEVRFGATVVVRDEEGCEKTYCIVGIDETDVKRGRVSWISPIAKALNNAKAGDVVTLKTPKGEEELEVIEVRYERID